MGRADLSDSVKKGSAELLVLALVEERDPAVIAAIVATLGARAAAASFVPARRASRVDPLVVLRDE